MTNIYILHNIHPSILLTVCPLKGHRNAGACPSCHGAKGDVHPGQVTGLHNITPIKDNIKIIFIVGSMFSNIIF